MEQTITSKPTTSSTKQHESLKETDPLKDPFSSTTYKKLTSQTSKNNNYNRRISYIFRKMLKRRQSFSVRQLEDSDIGEISPSPMTPRRMSISSNHHKLDLIHKPSDKNMDLGFDICNSQTFPSFLRNTNDPTCESLNNPTTNMLELAKYHSAQNKIRNNTSTSLPNTNYLNEDLDLQIYQSPDNLTNQDQTLTYESNKTKSFDSKRGKLNHNNLKLDLRDVLKKKIGIALIGCEDSLYFYPKFSLDVENLNQNSDSYSRTYETIRILTHPETTQHTNKTTNPIDTDKFTSSDMDRKLNQQEVKSYPDKQDKNIYQSQTSPKKASLYQNYSSLINKTEQISVTEQLKNQMNHIYHQQVTETQHEKPNTRNYSSNYVDYNSYDQDKKDSTIYQAWTGANMTTEGNAGSNQLYGTISCPKGNKSTDVSNTNTQDSRNIRSSPAVEIEVVDETQSTKYKKNTTNQVSRVNKVLPGYSKTTFKFLNDVQQNLKIQRSNNQNDNKNIVLINKQDFTKGATANNSNQLKITAENPSSPEISNDTDKIMDELYDMTYEASMTRYHPPYIYQTVNFNIFQNSKQNILYLFRYQIIAIISLIIILFTSTLVVLPGYNISVVQPILTIFYITYLSSVIILFIFFKQKRKFQLQRQKYLRNVQLIKLKPDNFHAHDNATHRNSAQQKYIKKYKNYQDDLSKIVRLEFRYLYCAIIICLITIVYITLITLVVLIKVGCDFYQLDNLLPIANNFFNENLWWQYIDSQHNYVNSAQSNNNLYGINDHNQEDINHRTQYNVLYEHFLPLFIQYEPRTEGSNSNLVSSDAEIDLNSSNQPIVSNALPQIGHTNTINYSSFTNLLHETFKYWLFGTNFKKDQ